MASFVHYLFILTILCVYIFLFLKLRLVCAKLNLIFVFEPSNIYVRAIFVYTIHHLT